ncbi:hypothetical protein EV127DRAFT_409443 [Xylaria flabelliformis]|nr:hypothetical protein EV127DRAFT_409443 [Xylaria flabelliformis]
MENQVLFSVDAGIIPVNTQIMTADHVLGYQTTPGSFGVFPAELWLMIHTYLHSKRDIIHLSSVNSALYSLLTFDRAKDEAKTGHSWFGQKKPSMLYVALKQGRPLDEIEKIVAGYVVGHAGFGFSLLETHLVAWGPPLHLAVGMNRIDVVKLILRAGVSINIRYGGNIADVCPTYAHTCCEGKGSKYCKNALDIARELKNSKIEQYLLRQGIEDLGRHEMIYDFARDEYEQVYSVEKYWWPEW